MGEVIKIIGEILGYASAALMMYFLYFIRNKLKIHPDTIAKKDVKVYKAIYEEMSLLLATGADRVYILEFHNGTDFSSSVLQWKISCTYELVRNGVSRMQDRLKGIMASSLSEYIFTFYSDKDSQLLEGVTRSDACTLCTSCGRQCTYRFDIDDMRESLLTADLHLQGIHGMFQVGIRNTQGNLVGILGIDFTKYEHWKTVKRDEFDIPHALKTAAMKIARIWKETKK